MDDTLQRLQNDLAAARFEMKQTLRAAHEAEQAAADVGDAEVARALLDMAQAFWYEHADFVRLVALLEGQLKEKGLLS